jgi:sarcosine oxidase subunit alpha
MSGAMVQRLGPQPGEVIDRGKPFVFTWNGRVYPAYAGDTIVSALAACGERVFSRSFKYHRPRGVLTADFLDPGCMLQVGDEPNVRGAHRLVQPGMDVRAQNVWPSLRVDLRSANGAIGRFLSAGFYYKTFIKPQRVWPAYESVLRRFASGGTIRKDATAGAYDKRSAHPDVVVAGGGPAGISVALAAARDGASVMLVDEQHALGGHLRWGDRAQLVALDELRTELAATPGIEVLTDSVVTGRYDHNCVAIVQRSLPGVHERFIKARAGVLVVAAGLIERPYVFAGNDLPGVMLSTAARRLINLYAVKPGNRAVVLTANADGDAAVADLRSAGVHIVRVVDARRGEDLVAVRGRGRVRAAELSDGTTVACDLVVTAAGWTAPTSLLNMAGDRPVYDPRAARFFPDPAQLPENVLVAGGLAGDGDLAELAAHAHRVGLQAARQAAGQLEGRVDAPVLGRHAHPACFQAPTHGFVDFCEDVTSKDLVSAVREGYDSIELVKRYTTVTMGPTQGKLETVNAVAIVAEATGRSIADTGTTVWRPPYAPISLGALAGRRHEPVRYSPLQPWHERHGAVPLVAGAWIRPDHYGDPDAEVRNVRRNVGLIDVTPIGKLDLRGPDVPDLLNFLYVNKWSKLAVGRVRYGAMCADDGVVMDDGVTGRIGQEHYIMSTTSSGAAAVWEWVDNWVQDRRWRVHVTPVTTAYASMNVAGPKSRELLARVCDGVDLSNEAFGYMHVRTGTIAGVDGCFMWRIGFTGELSYELHVPSAYGLHVWETLMDHGADLGVGAFGVEAQRIMRLEKGHLIVGQDTDGLTKGHGAGLDRLIKLDKDDFLGKPELVWPEGEGERPPLQLVGLQPDDPLVVPDEASQIVEGDRTIVGRITSSRMSPTLGRAICLGQVAHHLASNGTRVTVQLPDGRRIGARVTDGAHFDPDGERMRV